MRDLIRIVEEFNRVRASHGMPADSRPVRFEERGVGTALLDDGGDKATIYEFIPYSNDGEELLQRLRNHFHAVDVVLPRGDKAAVAFWQRMRAEGQIDTLLVDGKPVGAHEIVFPIKPTPELIERAREFVMRKWKERFFELFPNSKPDHAPRDLSNSCKFSSMFAQKVFGGELRGNFHHQYVEHPEMPNGILDLNHDADDVKRLANPYRHDKRFFGRGAHYDSMISCQKRVNAWVREFRRELEGQAI